MSDNLRGACIIGQSGGPSSVLNATAYGVISEALASPDITNVYGASHGIKGVIDGVESYQTLGLLLAMVLIPIVFGFISYILYQKKYKLDEKTYEDICRQLEERKAAANETVPASEPVVEETATNES